MRVMRSAALLIVVGLLCGCIRTAVERDKLEARDPLVKSALAKSEQGDKEGSILLLKRSLDRNPNSALAHLQIALLYDEYARDFARAIYHYQRYLELRPETDNRDMLVGRIKDAELRLCAALPGRLNSAAPEYLRLREENADLKRTIRKLRQNIAMLSTKRAQAARPVLPAERVVPTKEQAAGPRELGPRVYVVQAGDTLSSIATKHYENPRDWQRIHDANRGLIGDDPRGLKVNQELVIP